MKDNQQLWRWTSLAPLLLFFGALALLPVANILYMSFHTVQWAEGVSTWTPVGLENYERLPKDAFFSIGVWNTIVFSVTSVAIQMVLGFLLALAVVRIKWGSTFYKTIFILPILIPGIVIGAIWKLMLDFDFGVLNQINIWLGLQPLDWTGSVKLAMPAIIIVDVWHWTPFVFLLMLAGLQGLPEDVFEAAKVDGTGPFRELFKITLPLMLPTILVTLMFRIILAFKVFDEIFLLTGGGPGTATEVIAFSIFRTFFFENRVGLGSAMSFAVIFAVALLVVISLAAQRYAQSKG
ncbi:carbohydrate ABC transporter permease [Ruegeria hyattellae]|uniref:carbohydrate ABC transporter permease n=1 Tax=Ruegeria hyattellae TaxID=3233337 RepID=UPI00355B5EDF